MKSVISFMFVLILILSVNNYTLAEEATNQNENVKKEYIIVFKEKKDKKKNFIENENINGKILEDYKHLRVQMVELNEKAIKGLSKNPNIESIMENRPLEIKNSTVSGVDTNIKLMDDEWHLKAINESTDSLQGDGIKIAIFDTGINYHDNFKRGSGTVIKERVQCSDRRLVDIDNDNSCTTEMKGKFGFDDDDHGTTVASVIGSSFNGVAKNADLYSVRITGDILFNQTHPNRIMRALNWSIENNIDIINISHGLEEGDGILEINQEDIDTMDLVFQDVQEAGIQIFSSSGNTPTEKSENGVTYPARSPYVVAVGSVEIEDHKIDRMTKKSLESAYGPEVQIVAPGTNLTVSIGDSNHTVSSSGTSLASPLVAGVFAKMKQQFPTPERYTESFPNDPITTKKELNERLINLMKENAIPMNGYSGELEGYRDWEYGAGLIQVYSHGKKGPLDLTGKEYIAHERPNFDSPTETTIGNGKFYYYQEWNGWYKVDDGEGSKYWIDTNETIDVNFELKTPEPYLNMYKEHSALSVNIANYAPNFTLQTTKGYGYNKDIAEFEWYNIDEHGGGWIKASIKKELEEPIKNVELRNNALLYEYPNNNAPVHVASDIVSDDDSYKLTHSYTADWYLVDIDGLLYWVKKDEIDFGKSLFRDVNNRTVFTTTSSEFKLFDGLIDYTSPASAYIWSGEKVIRRFEQPVKASAVDVSFRYPELGYNIDVIFYGENMQHLQTVNIQKHGLEAFNELEEIYFVEIINKARETAQVSEVALFGDYDLKKNLPTPSHFHFISSVNKRSFYNNPVDDKFEGTLIRAIDNLSGTKFQVKEVYDWNEEQKQYNWMRVTNEELGVVDEWIKLGDKEGKPIFENDLVDEVYGQTVRTYNGDGNLLFDNTGLSSYIRPNGFVEYEFDAPVDISGLYIEKEARTQNDQLEVTLFREDGTSEKYSIGDDEMFNRYNYFGETFEGIKKVRVENVLETYLFLKEVGFFGNKSTTIGLSPIEYKFPITIRKGQILTTNNPNSSEPTLETFNLNEDYTTVAKKGFGRLNVPRRFEWILIELPNGEEKWINAKSHLAVSIDDFYRNGIIDKNPVSHVSGTEWGYAYRLLDNSLDMGVSYDERIKHDKFSFSESTSIQFVYLYLYDPIDNVDKNISLRFYDNDDNIIYTHSISREDLYRQYFELPEVVNDVKSFEILYGGKGILGVGELEFH